MVPVQNVSIIATLNDASPVSVIAGTPQSFSCATGANPNPAAYFQWYKGNKNITAAGVGGLKQIIFDKTDDGVELVCKGWNDATDTPFPSSVLSINVMCKCYKLFKELAFLFCSWGRNRSVGQTNCLQPEAKQCKLDFICIGSIELCETGTNEKFFMKIDVSTGNRASDPSLSKMALQNTGPF